MSKSLTEVAKSILMKEDTGIPEIRPEDAGSPYRDADKKTSLAATLKPGSKTVEGIAANPGAPGAGQFHKKQDLGPAPTKLTDVPGSAKAVVGGKDSSKPSKSSVAAEPPKKLAEEEEVDEDIEISEELEAFIENMVAEGASEDEIAAAIEENFEIVEATIDEEVEAVDEASPAPKPVKKDMADAIANYKGKVTKVDQAKDSKGKAKMAAEETEMEAAVEVKEEIDIKEHLDALFSGETLSEEFKAKAKTIFEAAVSVKVDQITAQLEEQYATRLDSEVVTLKEELSSDVEDYLNYVVEQWVSDNEVAIEAGLRTELTEEFISGLRSLFVEHYIDIPEDKVSVIEEMGSKIEELETKLNEEIERSVTLNKMLNESKTSEVLTAACEGLTAVQAEKLKSLIEGIEYADIKEFEQKITTLKESYFTENVKSENVLDKVESVSDGQSMIAEELSGPMAKYVATLGRTLK